MSIRIAGFNHGLVPKAFFNEAVPDFPIVDAQEFGSAGGHVNIVRFAFGTLLVQELVDRVIRWFQLDKDP